MTRFPLAGSMTALATPFIDGTIDQPAFVRLCQRQVDHGTSALVVCGSTGEAASLQLDEYVTLIRLAVATANGRIPVIAGCSGPSTDAAATAAALAARTGSPRTPAMHWQAKLRQALPTVVWVALVLAIAAYGSVVVRNVTDMLTTITHPAPAMVAIEQPRR